MTVAKSQQKNLPRFNALDTVEHYTTIQRDVRSTARKNPDLHNQTLRIHIEAKERVEGEDMEAEDEADIDEEVYTCL
jgi:hypothetical protein